LSEFKTRRGSEARFVTDEATQKSGKKIATILTLASEASQFLSNFHSFGMLNIFRMMH